MHTMWCRQCNIETEENICPVCGEKTTEDIPTEIFWCPKCKVPVLQEVSQADKGTCPCCGATIKHMASDIRPVFPEENCLISIILKDDPFAFQKDSVWYGSNAYIINGKKVKLAVSKINKLHIDEIKTIKQKYDDNAGSIAYEYFDVFKAY